MKFFFPKIRQFLASNWFAAAAALCLFLLTNRYIYGWDDQHLEIPLLKHLIDPTLYAGDYYVEGLKANFTSYLYPILSKVLSVDAIPTAYMILFGVVRLVFFYWCFRLWMLLSNGHRLTAFLATCSVFLIGRCEEFIYRTFSHQEFSFMFVFAGLYFFYRGRFLLASLILGLGANIHALYSLFPMLYLLAFLLFFQKEKKLPLLLKSFGTFVLAAMPFLLWTFLRAQSRVHVDPHAWNNWIELYLLSCPQNFLFGTTPLKEATASSQQLLTHLQNYVFVAVLYAFNFALNPDFRKDLKTHAMAIVVGLMLIITFVFTYLVPSHFILDLNLVRNEQYLRFIVSGYTVLLLGRALSGPVWKAGLLAVAVYFMGGKELVDIAVILGLGAALLLIDGKSDRNAWLKAAGFGILALAYVAVMGENLSLSSYKMSRAGALVGVLFLLGIGIWMARQERVRQWILPAFIVLPFAFMIVHYSFLHYQFIQISTKGSGFWQLQRNWEEMQHYVKRNTPKNALFMVPNDMEMGGFRIHSDRKILTDYRDCGIVGFDIAAAAEWQRRMKDIDAFKVIIKEPFTEALLNGIFKYKVDYIVFMRYAAPPDNSLLARVYENEVFSLYKVRK